MRHEVCTVMKIYRIQTAPPPGSCDLSVIHKTEAGKFRWLDWLMMIHEIH